MKLLIACHFVLVGTLFSSLLFAQDSLVDYSNKNNWAILPGSYPEELKEFIVNEPLAGIDVFYVYPTLILSEDDKRWNVPINDEKQRKTVINSAVRFQASAWANAGEVYVPYYRQAHLRSYYNLESGGRDALLLAYSDVKAAFEYYLKHYNKGKGIILAGHSQGGTHLSLLLKEFFDGKALQEQLVAAYLPGIGLEIEEFQSIPLMTSPTETHGFVVWNTFKKRYDQKMYKWYKDKAVINPVTWDTTELASSKLHQGFLFSNGKMYRHSFETHLDNGVIWITTPKFPYRYLAFTMKHYHLGDVNLFWDDIRLNAILRSQAYLSAVFQPMKE
jgi:hypothetical protein